MMTPKEIAINFTLGLYTDKDFEVINKYLDEDVIIHSLIGDFLGRNAMNKVASQWLTAFPDAILEVIESVCEGEFAVIHWQSTGTHSGIFKGIPPTFKKVVFKGILFFRVQNEKITEYAGYINLDSLLNQLK